MHFFRSTSKRNTHSTSDFFDGIVNELVANLSPSFFPCYVQSENSFLPFFTSLGTQKRRDKGSVGGLTSFALGEGEKKEIESVEKEMRLELNTISLIANSV